MNHELLCGVCGVEVADTTLDTEANACAKPSARGSFKGKTKATTAITPIRARCAICECVYHERCLLEADMKANVNANANANAIANANATGGCRSSSRLLCELRDQVHSSCFGTGEWHCESCANASYPFYTCWIALGDVQSETDGPLMLIPGSHHYQGYYHRTKVNQEQRLPTAFNLQQANQQHQWQWNRMQAGDIILFNIKTVHKAVKNQSQQYRISCDTRVTAAYTWT